MWLKEVVENENVQWVSHWGAYSAYHFLCLSVTDFRQAILKAANWVQYLTHPLHLTWKWVQVKMYYQTENKTTPLPAHQHLFSIGRSIIPEEKAILFWNAVWSSRKYTIDAKFMLSTRWQYRCIFFKLLCFKINLWEKNTQNQTQNNNTVLW